MNSPQSLDYAVFMIVRLQKHFIIAFVFGSFCWPSGTDLSFCCIKCLLPVVIYILKLERLVHHLFDRWLAWWPLYTVEVLSLQGNWYLSEGHSLVNAIASRVRWVLWCDVMCAGNVHSMLCCDEKLSLKEAFVCSSSCQHLVTFLQSVAVSLVLLIPSCLHFTSFHHVMQNVSV